EGNRERHLLQFLLHILEPAAEMLAHGEKGDGVRTLEAEDRLLHIADGENGAWTWPVVLADRALADEELLGQELDDLPLRGIGILRLVHQDMVDTAVELEQHPGRNARRLQQPARRQHEILVVERRAVFL